MCEETEAMKILTLDELDHAVYLWFVQHKGQSEIDWKYV